MRWLRNNSAASSGEEPLFSPPGEEARGFSAMLAADLNHAEVARKRRVHRAGRFWCVVKMCECRASVQREASKDVF